MESKLSLVAQYDDLIRNKSILCDASCIVENEFLQFVRSQDICRKRWAEVDTGSDVALNVVAELRAENTALKTKLKHARSQIEHEMKKRQKLESEKEVLENQVSLVREMVTEKSQHSILLNEHDLERLAFLSSPDIPRSPAVASPGRYVPIIDASASLLSPSDISFDKTEDDLEFSVMIHVNKKPPHDDTFDEDDEASPVKRQKLVKRRPKRHRRSRSAVVTMAELTGEPSAADRKQNLITDRNRTRHSSTPLKKTVSTNSVNSLGTPPSGSKMPYSSTPAGMRHQISAGSLSKLHSFNFKTLIKPESCIVCSKKIRFSSKYCKCRDCRAVSHVECKDKVPLPCMAISTPGTQPKHAQGCLSEYVPSESPMVPPLIVHCTKEIEDRGLSEVGIYRVPGSEREMKDLKETFLKNKGTPNLSKIRDINVICGCVKDFLRGLKEPVITYGLWDVFVDSAELNDEDDAFSAIYQAISQLPAANRDTLAYMILHLQRVSQSEECKMPVSNLAKVFGPTLIRYSTQDPHPLQMMRETRSQSKVIERLMSISADYWRTFIEGFPPAHSPEHPRIGNGEDGPVMTTPNFLGTDMKVGRPNRYFETPQ